MGRVLCGSAANGSRFVSCEWFRSRAILPHRFVREPEFFESESEGSQYLITIPESFNVASYFIDRNVREGRGNNVAIECGAEQVTYQALLERTNRVGHALRALDVRMEERVALLLPDTSEFVSCLFGIMKIGAVAVPLNTYLKPQEYEYLLNDMRARVLLIHETLLPQLTPIPKRQLEFLREIVVVGGHDASYKTLKVLMESASRELEAAPTSKDDTAFWLYSSGSTGTSKACIHLHHDMVVCSELYAKGILEITEHDRCYSVARLFFAYGLGNAGYFPLSCGATTILSPTRPEPAGIYANIERYRPTLFFSVPSNYAALLAHHRPSGQEFDLSSIRHAISAGESLPAPLFERFKERFKVEILDSLGSTETLQMVIANRPGDIRPGSSGKIIAGYEARIVDEMDRDVNRGEIGVLLIKGDSTCAGYWNRHEKTKETFQGAWFRTGDKYYQDEDGYFWYAGRADDLFKVNGRWVSPAEVESALIAHPAVQEAAVIAHEDTNKLIKPAAYVVIKHDLLPTEDLAQTLQDWVAQRIGPYKRPRWIKFLPELPKTSTGKVQRFKLRELQAQQGKDK
jgi:benzoate-CoA ligase family protein